MAHITPDELKVILGMVGTPVDLCGADLRGANLNGANLREADLRWADLRWADLSGVAGAISCRARQTGS